MNPVVPVLLGNRRGTAWSFQCVSKLCSGRCYVNFGMWWILGRTGPSIMADTTVLGKRQIVAATSGR